MKKIKIYKIIRLLFGTLVAATIMGFFLADNISPHTSKEE